MNSFLKQMNICKHLNLFVVSTESVFTALCFCPSLLLEVFGITEQSSSDVSCQHCQNWKYPTILACIFSLKINCYLITVNWLTQRQKCLIFLESISTSPILPMNCLSCVAFMFFCFLSKDGKQEG